MAQAGEKDLVEGRSVGRGPTWYDPYSRRAHWLPVALIVYPPLFGLTAAFPAFQA